MQRLGLLIALLVALLSRSAAAAPDVVVAIKPIHSLVAGVMAGVGEPGLIVSGGVSPHEYALKPSDAARLERAEVIFWIGPIFETFLAKPLGALARNAEVVELDRAPGVALLSAREGGTWEEDEDHHSAPALEEDGHLWLDPENAASIVRYVVALLSARDPANGARYAENGAALLQRIAALDARLRTKLAPVKAVPFVVFHDAYQYLERRYALAAIGSITVNPEHIPGARRLETIRAKIVALRARCVFSEPPFTPRLVNTVVDGTAARRGALDPEGAALAPGPDLYFELMDGLADDLARCLGSTDQ